MARRIWLAGTAIVLALAAGVGSAAAQEVTVDLTGTALFLPMIGANVLAVEGNSRPLSLAPRYALYGGQIGARFAVPIDGRLGLRASGFFGTFAGGATVNPVGFMALTVAGLDGGPAGTGAASAAAARNDTAAAAAGAAAADPAPDAFAFASGIGASEAPFRATGIAGFFNEHTFGLAVAGDLAPGVLTFRYDDRAWNAGGEIALSVGLDTPGAATVALLFGPSIRFTGRALETVTAINVAIGNDVSHATLALDEQLTGTYLGAVFGLAGEIPLRERLTLSVTGTVSPFRLAAHYEGTSSAAIDGLYATSATHPTLFDEATRFAWRGALDFGLGYQFDGGASFSLGVTADYLSATPTIMRTPSGAAQTAADDPARSAAAAIAPDEADGRLVALGFAPSFSLGIRAGVTIPFGR